MSLNKANRHLKVSADTTNDKLYVSMRYPLRTTILDNVSRPNNDLVKHDSDIFGFPWIKYFEDMKNVVYTGDI